MLVWVWTEGEVRMDGFRMEECSGRRHLSVRCWLGHGRGTAIVDDVAREECLDHLIAAETLRCHRGYRRGSRGAQVQQPQVRVCRGVLDPLYLRRRGTGLQTPPRTSKNPD